MIDELGLIHSIAHRLDKFKPVNGNQSYRFRCNICGDSKKSMSKSRGFFIYSKQHQKYFFKCHNCGISLSLVTYAKEYFPEEYKHYKIKTFIEKEPRHDFSLSDKTKEVLTNLDATTGSEHLLPLKSSDKAVAYVKSRQIPESSWYRLYYTPNIGKLVHDVDHHGKYENHSLPEDERLVIVIRDKDGNIKGIQGRSLPDNPTKLRYATYMFSDDNKIFGLDVIDWSRPVIVLEGAIDSLFLDNAIALNGGSSSVLKSFTQQQKENLIIALDNEPRHKDTVKRFEVEIDNGFRVVDWSKLNSSAKDINDMVLYGLKSDFIEEYILTHNASSARAKLNLLKWKKI